MNGGQLNEGEQVQLDYNLLILGHLSRLSRLSTTLMGEVTYSHGAGTMQVVRLVDKSEALTLGVNLLQSFIPEELEDTRYQEEVKKCKESLRSIVEKEEKLTIWDKIRSDLGVLRATVNLLARKGYLYENRGVMALSKERSEGTEWED